MSSAETFFEIKLLRQTNVANIGVAVQSRSYFPVIHYSKWHVGKESKITNGYEGH